VNLTPLIDVVFVVLIMFMVVAPLLELDRVELAPASEQPLSLNALEQQTLVITVKEDNSIWFQRHQVSFEELHGLLSEAHGKHPGEHLQVLHDRRAAFGTYQEIKNTAERAGFETLDIILQPS
jgi:biopolymer transport protein ExbD